MDSLSEERRSWNMSRIRGKNTSPEVAVRSLLHHLGYRFRIHVSDLPGTPDIVLPRYRTIVFVHGCFWHRHAGCRKAYTPKSRSEFWTKKFQDNIARDRHVSRALRKLGWHILTVWECELIDTQLLVQRIECKLGSRRSTLREGVCRN